MTRQASVRFVIHVALAVVVSCTPAFAQEGPAAATGALRMPGTASGRIVAPFSRTLFEPAPRGAAVNHYSAPRLMQRPGPAPSQGSWAGRHPIVLGTLIGAGGLSVWQAASCSGQSCNVGTAGIVGAGAGAYGGLVASAIHKAKRKQPLGAGTKIGLVVGAIGGAVGMFVACFAAGGCGGAS